MSNKDYSDIIHMEHHVSRNHPQMSRIDRAAQFAPFAALTGYEEAVEETARLTDQRDEYDDIILQKLDEKLNILKEHIAEHPLVSFVIFENDAFKSGGHYREISGRVRLVDEYNRQIKLENKTNIEISDIMQMESDLFEEYLNYENQ